MIWEHEREMQRRRRCSADSNGSESAEQEVVGSRNGVVISSSYDRNREIEKVAVCTTDRNLNREPEQIDSSTGEVQLTGHTEHRIRSTCDKDDGYDDQDNEGERRNIFVTRKEVAFKDVFLELNGEQYWSSQKEIECATEEARKTVKEMIVDLNKSSDFLVESNVE